MKAEIIMYINNNQVDLLNLTAKIDQEQINIIPFEGSWTVGQLLQHIIISNSGFITLLNGTFKDLTEVELKNG